MGGAEGRQERKMTISHERRKARIREYSRPLRDKKASCCASRCHQLVAIFRHIDGKTFPLWEADDMKYRALRRELGHRNDKDLRLFLESL